MTAKKVKDEEILENAPVEEPTETPTENPEPTPVEEEKAQEPAEEAQLEPVEEPTEEPKKEEKKAGKVEIKEVEYKHFDTIKAPAEIKKIIDFYGITSKDIFNGEYEKMWLKKEEVKAIKEWYATLI